MPTLPRFKPAEAQQWGWPMATTWQATKSRLRSNHESRNPAAVISRACDAPRELVYRAFSDPDHFAEWWGPIGNSLPRDEIDFDVRPGGYQRWTEVNPAVPDLRVHIYVALADVTPGELLEGVMHVSGRLQPGIEPFETRLRVEFYDEPDGRTRLEIRQWLPEHLAPPARRVGLRPSPNWTPGWPVTRLPRPRIEG